MIFFDVTKSGATGHASGLNRVSSRLREELGAAAIPVTWPKWDRAAGPADWFLTAELFSEAERPGFREFLRGRRCRCAAIFHDAIPLRYPRITWPQSVARHPEYLKLLAEFDRIWAVSAASRDEILGFWRWQGIARTPPVDVLPQGADYDRAPRQPGRGAGVSLAAAKQREDGPAFSNAHGRDAHATLKLPASLLCIGILEPRKNQSFLLDVCVELWAEGLAFDFDLVGRVNPHFGRPILAKIKSLRKEWPGLHYHAAASDGELARLFSKANATVLPTIAEGGALPLLESLWKGVPCVCSALPALHEYAAAGGCLEAPPSDAAAWSSALRAILADDALHERLADEATSRPLGTWADAAKILRGALEK